MTKYTLYRYVTVGGVIVSLLLLAVAHERTIWHCPFHWLTGLKCPCCGLTRALLMAWEGQWSAALTMNPLILVAAPLAVFVPLLLIVDGITGKAFLWRIYTWIVRQSQRRCCGIWLIGGVLALCCFLFWYHNFRH